MTCSSRILGVIIALLLVYIFTGWNGCEFQPDLNKLQTSFSTSKDILAELQKSTERMSIRLSEVRLALDQGTGRITSSLKSGFDNTIDSLSKLETQSRTLAEETRLEQEYHSSQERRKCKDRCLIDVNIIHYKSLDWLQNNLRSLRRRSVLPSHCICYNVITQEDVEEEFILVNSSIRYLGASIERYDTRGVIGSGAITEIMSMVANRPNKQGALITVIADADTLMLLEGWDMKLADMFLKDDDLMLAGINPRSKEVYPYSTAYNGKVEWNWMALRSSFFEGRFSVESMMNKHRDWEANGEQGYLFTTFVTEQNKKFYVWPGQEFAIPNRTAIITADPFTKELFVLHSFWSRSKYAIHPTDVRNIEIVKKQGLLLTPGEIQQIFDWASLYPTRRFAV